MKVVVCVDDRGGMMFNRRRQSRDRALIADLLASVGDSRLLIAPYSELLFEGTDGDYTVSENPLDSAQGDDICFVESISVKEYAKRISEVTVYKWNRTYPYDFSFDLDLDTNGFKLVSSYDFEGYSHEKITKEIYRR